MDFPSRLIYLALCTDALMTMRMCSIHMQVSRDANHRAFGLEMARFSLDFMLWMQQGVAIDAGAHQT